MIGWSLPKRTAQLAAEVEIPERSTILVFGGSEGLIESCVERRQPCRTKTPELVLVRMACWSSFGLGQLVYSTPIVL